MPQLDFATYSPQIVWLAITFVLLYVLMSRIALPRIAEVLEERQKRIQDDLDKAERLKADTERAIAEYERAMAEARERAHAIAAENRARINAEIEARRAEVDAHIEEKTRKAEERIAEAREAAMANVRDIALQASSAIVERLTGEAADETALAAAIDSTMGGR